MVQLSDHSFQLCTYTQLLLKSSSSCLYRHPCSAKTFYLTRDPIAEYNVSMIEYCKTFGEINGDEKSKVFEIFPSVFSDNRGSFSEVLKSRGSWPYENEPLWFNDLTWIKQVNRSKSKGGTVRGLHA